MATKWFAQKNSTMPAKTRLDKLLVERGLAQSRERAQALILAGRVLVAEKKIEKAGSAVVSDAPIRLLGSDLKYVGRGGLKLEAALQHWKINVENSVCLDVGASTGGFTDCLLQHGAAKVIAVDTGYGQIDLRLRNDPRVRLLERTNARYLKAEDINARVDLAVVDVSFISVTLVLPAVLKAASPREIIVLIKPQFEAGREHIGKGGIVRDPAVHKIAIEKVTASVSNLSGRKMEVIDSPILGAEGNREFLLHAHFEK